MMTKLLINKPSTNIRVDVNYLNTKIPFFVNQFNIIFNVGIHKINTLVEQYLDMII